MEQQEHLYILWTNDNPITAEKMVFMYAGNGLKKGWWKQVTIVIWGAAAQLVGSNQTIQQQIQELIAQGVTFSACKACADQLGVSATLESLGVEVKYWGEPLTEILKSHGTLLSI